jgi:hypothetical protein
MDHPAALASDGVTLVSDQPVSIRLRIEGLSPGKHSIASFHNWMTNDSSGWISWRLGPGNEALRVKPSYRVLHDDDCASMWREFQVTGTEPIVMEWTALADGKQPSNKFALVLNGLMIDGPDPSRNARKPSPSHGDEHAMESPRLEWTPVSQAIKQRLYLSTDYQAVMNASPTTKEFINEFSGDVSSIDLSDYAQGRELDPFVNYYWRVDTIIQGETEPKERGNIWRFAIRRTAFPGAEGYGRFARGGRGGRVLHVTSLNDSGPGSLRAAVEEHGPRTIVFDVGGTIELKSKLVIRNPYVTIAGQTAPGDGICVRGFTFGCLGTHDVIVRHVRIRVGDEAKTTMDGTGFASTDHAILDHCSISWSIDEAVSSRGAGNITLQRCIVSEALNVADHKKYQAGKGHSFAGSISGNIGSFHHNLVAHCAGRNWSLAGGLDKGGSFAGRLDIRNNVVYNWEHRTTDGGVKQLNFVHNFYIPGPATRVFHLLKPDVGSEQDPQQYFMAGNRMEGRDYDTDNWQPGCVIYPKDWHDRNKLERAFCDSQITEHTAEEAYADVMADVGANVPRSDSLDARILEEVRRRTTTYHGSRTSIKGIIDSQSDVGGWPVLSAGTAPTDSDQDGMPDAWEESQGLDPQRAEDGPAYSKASGYWTNLERYLADRAVRELRK